MTKRVRYGVYLKKHLVSSHDWISEAIKAKSSEEERTKKEHHIEPIISIEKRR
jgi:hypothetical protein